MSTGINVIGLTKHFLVGFKAYFTVQNQSLELSWGQGPVARQITGPREELAGIILLNGYNIKLAPNDLLFYL